MTCAALYDLARGLSRRLQEAGVRPGDRVAIRLDRCAEAVIAVHAVLLTGAAYVPIDPQAPALRTEEILKDCRPSAMISAKGVEPRAGGRRAPRPPRARPADEAYILYTSGSTGKPKGVVLTHANGAYFVEWALKAFRVAPGDKIAGLAPLQFDLSIFDVFASCAAGAALLPVPYPDCLFPASLSDFLRDNKISILYTVPSVMSSLRERLELERGAFPSLRLVLFAGEVMPEPTLRRWLDLAPRAEFHNLYGPTETNVCLSYKVPRAPAFPLPIGRPLPGTAARIVGKEKGELVISGPGVMKGYAGSSMKGSRSYRTGDIVSRQADGDFLFHGRHDEQLKIRGFRVEPREVERALLSHAGVAEAAVLPAQAGLAASVVRRGRGASQTALRRHLAERLPSYMIPAAFRFVEKLPRLSNGKLDRRSLLTS